MPKKEETTLLVKLPIKSFLPFWAPLYIEAPILDFWSVTPVGSGGSAHAGTWGDVGPTNGFGNPYVCTYFYQENFTFIAIFNELYLKVVSPTIYSPFLIFSDDYAI